MTEPLEDAESLRLLGSADIVVVFFTDKDGNQKKVAIDPKFFLRLSTMLLVLLPDSHFEEEKECHDGPAVLPAR